MMTRMSPVSQNLWQQPHFGKQPNNSVPQKVRPIFQSFADLSSNPSGCGSLDSPDHTTIVDVQYFPKDFIHKGSLATYTVSVHRQGTDVVDIVNYNAETFEPISVGRPVDEGDSRSDEQIYAAVAQTLNQPLEHNPTRQFVDDPHVTVTVDRATFSIPSGGTVEYTITKTS